MDRRTRDLDYFATRPAAVALLLPALEAELAADKVLALFGRAQPRDFLDVEALMGHFGPDRLLELAAQKDAGFDLRVFADALASVGRFSAEDFGLDHEALRRLVERMASWRDDLIQGLEFGNRSPERAAPVPERSLPHEPPEPPGLEL